MDTRKAVVHNFDPAVTHEDAVTIEGLEDLFNWASELVTADDPRARRSKEQKIRRDVLSMIQHSKESEAREKFADEISCLQRRVIALLQVVSEKMEENGSLKTIVLTQYMAMARAAQLEEEVKQLQAMTWYREEAEAERKHLMDALSKMKKERDFLEDLVTVAEIENERLARLYKDTKSQLEVYENRRWWHRVVNLFRNLSNCAAVS